MSRQSFRGAGGVGAVSVPYFERVAPTEEYDVGISPPELTDANRQLEGVLAVIASGVLVVVGIFVATWALGA